MLSSRTRQQDLERDSKAEQSDQEIACEASHRHDRYAVSNRANDVWNIIDFISRSAWQLFQLFAEILFEESVGWSVRIS